MRIHVLTAILCLAALGLSSFSAQTARASDDKPTFEAKLVAIEDLKRSGKYKDAALRAEELVTAHPDKLKAHVTYQDLQLAVGKSSAVRGKYRSAAKAKEASADDHYLLARLEKGRNAVVAFKAAIRKDPKHFWAHCGLGNELTQMRKFKDAAEALESAAALDEKSAIPPNLLGRLAEAEGKLEQAEKHYRAAIALDAKFTLARVNLGVLLVSLERAADAQKVLEEAAQLAPSDPMPRLGLGVAHLGAGKPEAAAQAFEAAIELDSNSVVSLNLLANAYFNLGRLEHAEKALERSRKIDENHAPTRVNFAHLYLQRAQNEQAKLEAEAAIALDDQLPEAHFMLGLYFERTSKFKKAVKAYKRGWKLAPENAVFPRALAILYAGQTKWRDALKMRQKVVELSDASVDSLLELGLAYFDAKKHKESVRSFENVLRDDAENQTAWLNLGVLWHHHVRDHKKAIDAYRKYLNYGGKDDRVRDWLTELESR